MDSDSDTQQEPSQNSSEDAVVPSDRGEASLPPEIPLQNGTASRPAGGEQSHAPKTKKPCYLFGMTLVNSYGSADVNRLQDDGKPIKFTSRYPSRCLSVT